MEDIGLKKMIIVTMVAAVLLSGCEANDRSTSPTKVNGESSQGNVVTLAPSSLLSESSDKKVSIYGIKEEGDLFSSLEIVINGDKRTFDWRNVTNPSFYPQISVIDLNEDGEEEIVIVLTKATGTGIHDSEVHVLKTDFTEIPVSNPTNFLQEKIQVELEKDKEKEVREYTIVADGQKHIFKFNESDANQWYEKPTFQNILRYGIKDQELIAEIPIQISEGNYLGDAIVKYAFIDGKLEPSVLEISEEGSSL